MFCWHVALRTRHVCRLTTQKPAHEGRPCVQAAALMSHPHLIFSLALRVSGLYDDSSVQRASEGEEKEDTSGPGEVMYRGRKLKNMPVSQLRRLLVEDFSAHASSGALRGELIKILADAVLRAEHGSLASSPLPVSRPTVRARAARSAHCSCLASTAKEMSRQRQPTPVLLLRRQQPTGISKASAAPAPPFASPSMKRTRDVEDAVFSGGGDGEEEERRPAKRIPLASRPQDLALSPAPPHEAPARAAPWSNPAARDAPR